MIYIVAYAAIAIGVWLGFQQHRFVTPSLPEMAADVLAALGWPLLLLIKAGFMVGSTEV